jgi:hypothetical protein
MTTLSKPDLKPSQKEDFNLTYTHNFTSIYPKTHSFATVSKSSKHSQQSKAWSVDDVEGGFGDDGAAPVLTKMTLS